MSALRSWFEITPVATADGMAGVDGGAAAIDEAAACMDGVRASFSALPTMMTTIMITTTQTAIGDTAAATAAIKITELKSSRMAPGLTVRSLSYAPQIRTL